jgi:hypothetical protein
MVAGLPAVIRRIVMVDRVEDDKLVKDLDYEWVMLLSYARKIGITCDEVRLFFQTAANNKLTNMDIEK